MSNELLLPPPLWMRPLVLREKKSGPLRRPPAAQGSESDAGERANERTGELAFGWRRPAKHMIRPKRPASSLAERLANS